MENKGKITNWYGLSIKIDNLNTITEPVGLEVSGEKVEVRVEIVGVKKDFTFAEFLVRLGFDGEDCNEMILNVLKKGQKVVDEGQSLPDGDIGVEVPCPDCSPKPSDTAWFIRDTRERLKFRERSWDGDRLEEALARIEELEKEKKENNKKIIEAVWHYCENGHVHSYSQLLCSSCRMPLEPNPNNKNICKRDFVNPLKEIESLQADLDKHKETNKDQYYLEKFYKQLEEFYKRSECSCDENPMSPRCPHCIAAGGLNRAGEEYSNTKTELDSILGKGE